MLAIPTAIPKAGFHPQKARTKLPVSPPVPSDRIVADYGPWQSLDDFREYKEIGRGRLSVVWSAKCKDTGLKFAIKKYRKQLVFQGPMTGALQQNIQREVALLKSLRGVPSICHLYGTFEDAEGAYLVQEYCPGGDLLDVLKEFDGSITEDIFVPLVLVPLLKCLQRVHEKGIMHRDLKPENIFIDAAGQPRLGDFGLGINFVEEQPTERVGTLDYMAPEVLIHATRHGNASGVTPAYTYKVDTWAVGILAYEMLVGAPPFEVAAESNTAALILWTDVPINGVWPAHLSYEAISFIKWALRKVADTRPSTAEMLSHPWLIKHCPELQPAAASVKPIRVKPVQTSAHADNANNFPRNGTMPNILASALAKGCGGGDAATPDDDPFESAPSSFAHGKSFPSVGSLQGGGHPGSPVAPLEPRHFGSLTDMKSMQMQHAMAASYKTGAGAGAKVAPTPALAKGSVAADSSHQGMPMLVRSAANMSLNNKWVQAMDEPSPGMWMEGDKVGSYMSPEVGSWASPGTTPNDSALFGVHRTMFRFEEEDDEPVPAVSMRELAAMIKDDGAAILNEDPVAAAAAKKSNPGVQDTRSFPIAEMMMSRNGGSWLLTSTREEVEVRSPTVTDASKKVLTASGSGREAAAKPPVVVGGNASKKDSTTNTFAFLNLNLEDNGVRLPTAEPSREARKSGPGALGGRPAASELTKVAYGPYGPMYHQLPAADVNQENSPSGPSRCILPALVKA